MHGFPLDLNIDGINGAVLHLGLGQHSLQLGFDEGGVMICVEGLFKVKEHGRMIAEWTQDKKWSSLAFQKILDGVVIRYKVVNARLLEIELEDGLTLQIHDDSENYETAQIYFEDAGRPAVIV